MTMGGKAIEQAQARQAEQTRVAQEQMAAQQAEAKKQEDLARQFFYTTTGRMDWEKLTDAEKAQYRTQASNFR
jgi:hypothetical protein